MHVGQVDGADGTDQGLDRKKSNRGLRGASSLSKAYGLIERFSENIDVTIYRDDLGEAASVEELEALSGRKRQARLDTIRNACSAYITGPVQADLAERLTEATDGTGRIEIDKSDRDA